ncbi:MAG: flagellar basal-body MS-ring/collar protein FliF [Pseudomonadota bacterium]
MPQQLQNIASNLAALGPRRLGLMAATLALIMVVVGFGARFVNQPEFETLYIGIERDDINRMGIVLSEAGIGYDVDSGGTSISVARGKTSQARMILAEKGLPASSGSGYELFDNLGSLGLTSFMQEVTKVRVLEGELSRSIQAINGVKAARVHLVLPDQRSFSNRNRPASASVLVRTDGSEPKRSALAIRHLVAAAVPQLSIENVTVLDGRGLVLAAGEDPATNMLTNSIGIQQTVEDQLAQKVTTALTPYLGTLNFRVSVQATIDTDKRQTEETIFDPESRIERSVQVVKTQDQTSQRSASEPVSVEQNLPNAEEQTAAGPQSSQESERREETTNYEINSKKVATVSNGYSIARLSASIIVNQAIINELLGPNASAQDINQRIAQIERVAKAALGYDDKRGDLIDVSAVEFADTTSAIEPVEARLSDTVMDLAGTYINAFAFVIGSLLLALLGIRPLINAVLRTPDTLTGDASILANDNAPALDGPKADTQLPAPQSDTSMESAPLNDQSGTGIEAAPQEIPAPEERLRDITNRDQEAAARVLKRWVGTEAA